MSSAIETRDVLSKLDGVIRVHPNGLNGKAKVFVRDPKKFDQKDVETAMETTKDLRVRKIKRTRA